MQSAEHSYPIVVVEDEVATRTLLTHQLQRAGYDVTACENGRCALSAVRAMNSGIVIADWSMPEMDGLELCGAIRELEHMAALGRIYFILLTANTSKDQTITGLQAGANDYLTKPYHGGELLARIQVGSRMLRLQEELLHKTLAYQKANAEMALLSRKLEELANTDTLTSLASRRHLLERFAEAWSLADRQGLPLSCIMLDVDRFKDINDAHGHAVGDDVLRALARHIRRNARRPDLCGRFGGEEFVILCPATTAIGALSLAERLRTEVEAERIPVPNGEVRMTVSCGVAEKSPGIASPEALLRVSDAMMYAAKDHGRNQTWVMERDTPRPSWETAFADEGALWSV